MEDPHHQPQFSDLTTSHIIESVENALGRTKLGSRATGSILQLNSLENRVFQLSFEDGLKVVTKFYRPGRWTEDQLFEEHDFLIDLEENEVPAVSPLPLPHFEMESLGQCDKGFYFAVFPSVGGRLVDELTTERIQLIGRYLARIHQIGKRHLESSRPRIDAHHFGELALEQIKTSQSFETQSLEFQYENIAKQIIELSRLLLKDVLYTRIHGDCHLGNILWQENKAFFLDFDDTCMGPPVQDVWMSIRGRDEEAEDQRQILIEAYQQLMDFDSKELRLIEVLRGLRIIHYSAWIAKRKSDPAFQWAFKDFGSARYWQDEISELQRVLDSYQSF